MAVKQTTPKFVTSDGTKFDDKAAAERYEELIEAKRMFQQAKATYDRLLATTQKTADGEPFTGFSDYWHVGWYSGELRCWRVSFYEYAIQISDDGTISIKPYGAKDCYLNIGELYQHERNAKVKYAEHLREKRIELDKEIEQIERWSN